MSIHALYTRAYTRMPACIQGRSTVSNHLSALLLSSILYPPCVCCIFLSFSKLSRPLSHLPRIPFSLPSATLLSLAGQVQPSPSSSFVFPTNAYGPGWGSTVSSFTPRSRRVLDQFLFSSSPDQSVRLSLRLPVGTFLFASRPCSVYCLSTHRIWPLLF